MPDPRADNTSKCPSVAPWWCVCVCVLGGGGGGGGLTSNVKNKRRNRHQNCKLLKGLWILFFYQLNRNFFKAETAVHGCPCSGDMAVHMRKVLAIPRSCVVWPMQFKLGFLIIRTVLIRVCHPKGFWWAYFWGSLFRRGLSFEGISVAFKNGLGLK